MSSHFFNTMKSRSEVRKVRKENGHCLRRHRDLGRRLKPSVSEGGSDCVVSLANRTCLIWSFSFRFLEGRSHGFISLANRILP